MLLLNRLNKFSTADFAVGRYVLGLMAIVKWYFVGWPASREYAGTFTPTELREYFDEVGFVMEEQSWLDYGLAYTADIIYLEVNHG